MGDRIDLQSSKTSKATFSQDTNLLFNSEGRNTSTTKHQAVSESTEFLCIQAASQNWCFVIFTNSFFTFDFVRRSDEQDEKATRLSENRDSHVKNVSLKTQEIKDCIRMRIGEKRKILSLIFNFFRFRDKIKRNFSFSYREIAKLVKLFFLSSLFFASSFNTISIRNW